MIESSAVKRKKKELELLANVIKHAISKVTYSDNDYLLHKNTLLNTKFRYLFKNKDFVLNPVSL